MNYYDVKIFYLLFTLQTVGFERFAPTVYTDFVIIVCKK